MLRNLIRIDFARLDLDPEGQQWLTKIVRAEGFSCSFDVLYGGLGMSKEKFLSKIYEPFFSLNSSFFGHQNPGSGSALKPMRIHNAGINHLYGFYKYEFVVLGVWRRRSALPVAGWSCGPALLCSTASQQELRGLRLPGCFPFFCFFFIKCLPWLRSYGDNPASFSF